VTRLLRGGKLSGENPAVELLAVFNLSRECAQSTYRSAEPVSKSRFKVVPPIDTGVRYSSSLLEGVLVATPLAAAAAWTCDGTVAPYLERARP